MFARPRFSTLCCSLYSLIERNFIVKQLCLHSGIQRLSFLGCFYQDLLRMQQPSILQSDLFILRQISRRTSCTFVQRRAVYTSFREPISVSFIIQLPSYPGAFECLQVMPSIILCQFCFTFCIIDTYIKPALILIGFLLPFSFSLVRSQFWSLYEANFGELFSILYTACEPEINKAYLFGIRIGGLVVGWFALLFILELVLRLVLIVIRAIYGGIVTLIYGSKSKDVDITSNVDEKLKSE